MILPHFETHFCPHLREDFWEKQKVKNSDLFARIVNYE
jgi:hypothetical protein